ncbi:general stress protein [Halobacillus mangrovi]|uniref:Uncharacterized protein n=1 Tax=Halobacillus mangrovi TaxID=402384 RepID=A0A1W5ZWT7_9BACI|nr:general stress protein [Halobacillus mangrovi]ARI77772.1 hypothetical protein HM131_13335 [Halobacillus mangrovi]
MNTKIIGGVFSNVGDAERAIKDLQHHGYGSNDISVFAKDKSKVNVLEDEMDTPVSTNKGGRGKNAGKGAGLGALSGGVLGGIGGLITGLGLLAIPGIGQIAAAGPIAAALTGAGVGAGGGGIVGALVGAGMSEHEAKQYESHLKDGKIIVIVEASEKIQDKVYRTFLSNKTENESMYPDSYRNNNNHNHNHKHNQNSHHSHTTTDHYDRGTKEEAYTGNPSSQQKTETRTKTSMRRNDSRTQSSRS